MLLSPKSLGPPLLATTSSFPFFDLELQLPVTMRFSLDDTPLSSPKPTQFSLPPFVPQVPSTPSASIRRVLFAPASSNHQHQYDSERTSSSFVPSGRYGLNLGKRRGLEEDESEEDEDDSEESQVEDGDTSEEDDLEEVLKASVALGNFG
jgi:hypothetical protein